VSTTGRRFGPLWLAPDVTRVNMLALFAGAYATIGLLTFIALSTPLVLTLYLKVPQAEQGTISGYLHVFQEIVAIAVFGAFGVLADRIGRRSVYVMGLVFMGLGYGLYSYASSVPELFAYRFIYALGICAATGMLGTIAADYVEERSRGIAVALTGVLNAIGVISVVVFLGGLPQFFVRQGASQEAAGHDAHLVVAGICFLVAGILAWGLKPGTLVRREERLSFGQLMRSGVAEARNPRIALAYASGFIARSDLVLLGTYLTLWGTTAASNSGMEPADALAAGRKLFGIASGAALLWLPVIGLILDRVNRITGVIICMTLACAGYLLVSLVDDPLASSAIPYFVILGIGQISAFAGAQTLIAREAPVASRGSVIGMFNAFGAIGIFVSTAVGGVVFDQIAPWAPFVFIGLLTLLLIAAAVLVRMKSPGPLVEPRGMASMGH
jgi:MFS family permease